MRVVVLGARGGVGRHAVALAAAAGHEVVAGARSLEGAPTTDDDLGSVTPVAVDVRDATAVAEALRGADAVLWCVGVTGRSGGDVGRSALPGALAAAAEHGVRRWVSVSGAGVTLPEDRKGTGARLVSSLTRRFARDLVEDKVGEHEALAASGLAWTEVRPPRLVDRPPTGRWLLDDSAPGLTARPVARADVAAAMLHLAGSEEWVERSPFLHAARD